MANTKVWIYGFLNVVIVLSVGGTFTLHSHEKENELRSAESLPRKHSLPSSDQHPGNNQLLESNKTKSEVSEPRTLTKLNSLSEKLSFRHRKLSNLHHTKKRHKVPHDKFLPFAYAEEKPGIVGSEGDIIPGEFEVLLNHGKISPGKVPYANDEEKSPQLKWDSGHASSWETEETIFDGGGDREGVKGQREVSGILNYEPWIFLDGLHDAGIVDYQLPPNLIVADVANVSLCFLPKSNGHSDARALKGKLLFGIYGCYQLASPHREGIHPGDTNQRVAHSSVNKRAYKIIHPLQKGSNHSSEKQAEMIRFWALQDDRVARLSPTNPYIKIRIIPNSVLSQAAGAEVEIKLDFADSRMTLTGQHDTTGPNDVTAFQKSHMLPCFENAQGGELSITELSFVIQNADKSGCVVDLLKKNGYYTSEYSESQRFYVLARPAICPFLKKISQQCIKGRENSRKVAKHGNSLSDNKTKEHQGAKKHYSKSVLEELKRKEQLDRDSEVKRRVGVWYKWANDMMLF